MAITITLQPEVLEATVRDFFKDYFDEMIFKQSEVPVIPVLSSEVPSFSLIMVAYKGSYKFGYTFFMDRWNGYFNEGSEFHRLEHMKGDCVRSEQNVILENKKNN